MHTKLLQWCPTLCDLMDYSSPGSSAHGDSPGKNTGVGCHALLQGIFRTQGSNLHLLCLLHWQVVFFTTSTTKLNITNAKNYKRIPNQPPRFYT